MSSKIKNIIIFVVVAIALILAYVFFFKPAPAQPNLTTSAGTSAAPGANVSGQTAAIGGDFLSLLLSVKSIKLDDSIFSNPAFASLRDSSIELVLDPSQVGRPIPFAPIGSDAAASANSTQTSAPAPAPAGALVPTSSVH